MTVLGDLVARLFCRSATGGANRPTAKIGIVLRTIPRYRGSRLKWRSYSGSSSPAVCHGVARTARTQGAS